MPKPGPYKRSVYLHPAVWLAYGALFGVAIPWYWPEGTTALWLGIPVWAAVSIGTSAVISIFTAWLLLRHWPTDDELDPDQP